MQISDEAREECEQVSLHRNACLRKARWFCTNYCSQFPDTDKCDTHCEGEAKPCREVCRPNGHCHTECAELPSQPEDEPMRSRTRKLLLERGAWFRSGDRARIIVSWSPKHQNTQQHEEGREYDRTFELRADPSIDDDGLVSIKAPRMRL